MARRSHKTSQREKKPKPVLFRLIEEDHEGKTSTPYRLMHELVQAHHPHLADAKIAIAWRFGWKADTDGRIRLGQLTKASDLHRELAVYDLVILLNHEVWNQANFSEAQMRALLDHQLCHAQVAKDRTGETREDERGRTVYRIRHHDIEEFRDVVQRHGVWSQDLEDFARAAVENKTNPLFPRVVDGGEKKTA